MVVGTTPEIMVVVRWWLSYVVVVVGGGCMYMVVGVGAEPDMVVAVHHRGVLTWPATPPRHGGSLTG